MALFSSGNPALRAARFEKSLTAGVDGFSPAATMTERGTLNKFGFLFLMVVGAASFGWYAVYQGVNMGPWILGSAVAAFVIALIIAFRPQRAATLSPAYAILKGIVLGGVSALYAAAFAKIDPLLVPKAVGLTFGTVAVMYVLYRTGVIRATQKFRAVVFGATMAIALFYLVSLVINLVGGSVPFLHQSTPLSIGLSVFIVVIAALNLIMDFDTIETGVAMGAPKYMEWYGAFGLLVTIVWLYLEMLRLLGKISGRR